MIETLMHEGVIVEYRYCIDNMSTGVLKNKQKKVIETCAYHALEGKTLVGTRLPIT